MLLFVSLVKLIAEITLLSLLGQGLLALLAGTGRDGNLFYKILQAITRPVVRGTRLITPGVVIDRHVPLVAFLLVAFMWVAATALKIELCIENGVNTCQ